MRPALVQPPACSGLTLHISVHGETCWRSNWSEGAAMFGSEPFDVGVHNSVHSIHCGLMTFSEHVIRQTALLPK